MSPTSNPAVSSARSSDSCVKKKLWCRGVRRCQRLPDTRAVSDAASPVNSASTAPGAEQARGALEIACGISGVRDVVPHGDRVEAPGVCVVSRTGNELAAAPTTRRQRTLSAGEAPRCRSSSPIAAVQSGRARGGRRGQHAPVPITSIRVDPRSECGFGRPVGYGRARAPAATRAQPTRPLPAGDRPQE